MSAGAARRERGSGVLGQAVHALAASTGAAQAMHALVATLLDDVADWCVVDLLEPPDLVTRVVAQGRAGPLDLPPELGPAGVRRSSAEALGLLARLADAPGRSVRLTREDLEGMRRSPEPRLRGQGELGLRLGSSELLVLGLSHRDALLGVLAVGRSRGGFAPAEVDLLSDVAVVAGLALDGLRLLQVQRDVSAALQRTLLPRLPVVPGLALAARFQPAGQTIAVGGDWYDAFVLPAGGTALVVGDATGHDVRAAARMAELRNLLRAVALDRQQPPAATLGRLDRVVAQMAPELSGTCLYVQLTGEPGSRRMSWSSAGHLPPVLLRDGRAALLETEPDLMLGVQASTWREDHARDLRDGDLLVLYTDGLVEQRRAGLDERLQVLLGQVEALGGDDPEHVADGLVGRLWSGEDDVAVLVVRVGPAAGRTPPAG